MAPDKELPGVVFEGAIDIFRRIKAAPLCKISYLNR